MFFKKLEFTSLQTWIVLSIWYNPISIAMLSHLIAFVLLILLLVLSTGVFIRAALFLLSFFFIMYWVISIFLYLFKKGQYSVFTRIIQRFWKRTLWLFWLIELFLFSIYLFLVVISPQEVTYMLNNVQLITDCVFSTKVFFNNTLNTLTLILLINIQILLHKTNTLRQITNAFIFILLFHALIEDFLQFYSINSFYGGYAWTHSHLESKSESLSIYKVPVLGIWEQEVTELKLRTGVHYLYLLIFLKLWHTVFIFIVFMFLENVTLRRGKQSYNILAANLQNFYFLMFFNYILKVVLVKSFLNYFGAFVFYWFFINYNVYDFTYVYFLFNINYFNFLWRDLIWLIQ